MASYDVEINGIEKTVNRKAVCLYSASSANAAWL